MLSKPRASIHVSVVTEAELRFGVAKSSAAPRNARLLESFLQPLQVIDFQPTDAVAYGTVRARLERAGTPIGPVDTLIAAQAIARKLVLVTNNEREFKRVQGIHLENWAS